VGQVWQREEEREREGEVFNQNLKIEIGIK
jgi:hypothetical protein